MYSLSMTFLSVSVFLLLPAAVIFLLAALIKRIKRKPSGAGKTAKWLFISAAALFLLSMIVSDASFMLPLFSAVLFLAAFVLLIAALIGKLRKRDSKKLWSLFLAFLIAASALRIVSDRAWNKAKADPSNYEVSVETEYDFTVEDGDSPIELVYSTGFDGMYSGSYHVVYESSDYPLLLEDTGVGQRECLEALEANIALSETYKEYFSDFIRRIGSRYPDADLSVLYANLETLKVVELDQWAYTTKSMSTTSLGVYFNNENTIYIPEGTVYEEGEFGYQVLIHEFCHAARTRWWDENGTKNRISFKVTQTGTDNTILAEAMNSVFSCSLLNYYEWDIAYQVPSNYLRIMLECMDNYSLSDYMNHSDLYFLKMADEATGYTNYSQVIWKLITLQRSDWERTTIDIPAEEYRPIYDYLCDMYYGKYIRPGMSYDGMKSIADELVYRAFYDAPDGYKTDPDYFYEYLDTWIENNL